jgi:K+-transporting ATPase A subunit
VSVFNFLQYALFVIVVAALVKPLGGYMARAFGGENVSGASYPRGLVASNDS